MTQPDQLNLSIIIPVYNRPVEVEELLQSLTEQIDKDFEVIIVEDGSSLKCEQVVKKYKGFIEIKYFYKNNSGPGATRNFGCENAGGNYYLFVDSDCIVPPQYIQVIKTSLQKKYLDAFGGPDMARADFTILQRAINYSMTSFITTGGIRGGGEKLDRFYPRSFNMGFSKNVFEKTGGFPSLQFANIKAAGEDIELSIKIREQGFKVGLMNEAFVYHKRRTSIKQFWIQTFNFGFARITLSQRNKGTLKFVHLLPSLFVLGLLFSVILSIWLSAYFILPILFFTLLIFADAVIKNKNIQIGFAAVITTYIQLIGYGLGFILAFIKTYFKNKPFINLQDNN